MEETSHPSVSKKQRRSLLGGTGSGGGLGGSSIARRSIGSGGARSLTSGGGFGGFSTAWEVKDTLAAQQAEAARKKQQHQSTAAQKENQDAQKRGANGTSNNDDDGDDGKPRANNSNNEMETEAAPLDAQATQYSALPLSTPVTLTLTLRGTQFHKGDFSDNSTLFYQLLKKGSQELKLEREPDNEYDGRAIRVGCCVQEKAKSSDECEAKEGDEMETVGDDVSDAIAESSSNDNPQSQPQPQPQLRTIGHIAKEQAAILSPYLDAGCLHLSTVVVAGKDAGNSSWYKLRVSGKAKDLPTMLQKLDGPMFSNVVDVDSFLSKGLGKVIKIRLLVLH